MKPVAIQRKLRQRRTVRGRGFVLVEVLVAALIFAFGVLGIVGLQANLTRAQTESKSRADGAYLASELLGRMWADSATNLSKYDSSRCESHPNCLAWLEKVRVNLRSGGANVSVNNLTNVVTIRVTWQSTDGAQHAYATQSSVNIQTNP